MPSANSSISCCATAGSPTKRAGASNASSISRRRASPASARAESSRRCSHGTPPRSALPFAWSREETMKICWFVLGALLAWGTTPIAAQDSRRLDDFRLREAAPTQLKQVAPDLYFLYDDISSNSAFLVTNEGVLVVDTRQHPAHGRDLIERIRKITDKPIKWAINTHAHGDHFLGNPEFKAVGTTILAHRDTLAGIIKYQDLEIRRRQAFFKQMNLDPNE